MGVDDALRRLIDLGRELYRARDYPAAEKVLNEVVAQRGAFADVHNMLGVILHDRDEPDAAALEFTRALRINPSYTEAALNLAVTYNDLGRYAEAREIYAAAVQRSRAEPGAVDSHVKGKLANLHADLGAAYAEAGLYGDAVREYQRALDLRPGFVDLRTRLAMVHRDLGDPQAAADELERVREQSPGYLPARLALGTTYYTLGRRADAVREWEAVLALDAGSRAARAFLAMARELDRGKPA